LRERKRERERVDTDSEIGIEKYWHKSVQKTLICQYKSKETSFIILPFHCVGKPVTRHLICVITTIYNQLDSAADMGNTLACMYICAV
jgi:hypothetical protein